MAHSDVSSCLVLSADGDVSVHLGNWIEATNPEEILFHFESKLRSASKQGCVRFEGADSYAREDALVVAVLVGMLQTAKEVGFSWETSGLTTAVRKLVDISLAVPARGPKEAEKDNFVVRLGERLVGVVKDSRGIVEFTGELLYCFGLLLIGKARFRRSDFWVTLQNCGVSALPIVGLISVLVGIILAFVGGVQLQKFGATIFVVDLVALAMAREMGCIMTGVIMSGRTGASFAAQIGSMNVNEEVDALETLGFSAMEYLVLPRALAMVLMMPLLTIYSDVLGCVGGFIVAAPMGISPNQFWAQLVGSMTLTHIGVGIFKSFFFGVIVAGTGCYYGLRSGRSSASVGDAATKAVVAGITWIIVLDAVFAFLFQLLEV